MSKIKVMSELLANKIAAGEVVERIANVVKELVENSLDAGGKNIKVELIDAGTTSIKITDDGSGMDEEDAEHAFLRHATSKIYHADDLFFISSLGFRGEALPSIASVAKVTLVTSQGEAGTKIEIHGGKLINKEKSAAHKGTTITVSDLFYNTPARLKYLKSEQTELANVSMYIEKLALAYPSVAFNLVNNNSKIIETSGSGNLLKTIHEIYGLSISKNMLAVKGFSDDYDVTGFVCQPSILKTNRNYLTTIVNGRVVRNNEINRIINDAYHTYKPEGKFPIVVLHITTDPTLVDVNIHPTKQDIKFSKMAVLEEVIFTAIKNALNDALLIPKVEVKTTTNNNEISILKEYPNLIPQDMVQDVNLISETPEQINFAFTENATANIKELELYPCGLVMGTYIVAQNDEGMYLIDQHAAQERINYEKILKALASKELIITELLVPITIELPPSDYLLLKENMHILEGLGFNLTEFGINTMMINAHPLWLREGYEEESCRKIIDLVLALPKKFDKNKFNDSVAATLACKMSVKGNTNLTTDQMESLLKDLVKCDNPYNCPHGRPTIITFTKYELEKMFKRIMN